MTLQFALKVFITVVIVIAASELAKRSSFWAAVLISLPTISLLAFVWLYVETGSVERVAVLSRSIFWLVLPSLPLFLVLPMLLRAGVSFWLALGTVCLVTIGAYFGMVWLLGRAGVRL